MIRRSSAIALAALLVSLAVHWLVLNVSWPDRPENSATNDAPDVVALGNEFEDVADTVSEPVPSEPAPTPVPQPEPANVPEPPVETPPDPEPAEAPTSDALVASADPQRVSAPDTGSARTVQPDTAGSPDVLESASPQPTPAAPAEAEDAAVAEPATTEPAAPEKTADAAEGRPQASPETTQTAAVRPEPTATVKPVQTDAAKPVQATAAQSAETDEAKPIRSATANPVQAATGDPTVAPSATTPVPLPDTQQQIAALPLPVVSAPTVTPAPGPAAVPAISAPPAPPAPIVAETPDAVVAAVPEAPAPVEARTDPGTSELAVTASPRPRLPDRRPSDEPRGLRDGTADSGDLLARPTQLMESPLAAYRRGQTDLGFRPVGRTLFGATGLRESRGPGNSDVTNYAGRVLVHLNRAPFAYVSARGFARVVFEINPDGSLAWVDIIDSSGSREIDRAAKEQVRSAAPFPRPPEGASRKLAFYYQIN